VIGTDPHPDVDAAGAAGDAAAVGPSEGTKRGPDLRRERQLKALRARLSTLRDSLVAVREGTRQLAAIELRRRLTPQEADRARSLRWEGERLRHELQLLRERFESLGPPPAGKPGRPAGSP
jgi:hypothetical protein